MAAGPTLYIRLSQVGAGHAQYQFGPGADMSLLSLRAVLDTTSSAADVTIYVTHSAQSGDVLYDQYVAVDTPTGGESRFSLAPEANPCDSFTAGSVTAVTDTFPQLVFAENDFLDVYAVDAVTGAVVTDTPITSARLLVSDASTGLVPALGPLLVPAPLSLSGFALGAGG